MRDLYDTIATGPVQGDSHRAILKSVAADLAGMAADAPAEALRGDLAPDGRVMRVDAEDGRVRGVRMKLTEQQKADAAALFAEDMPACPPDLSSDLTIEADIQWLHDEGVITTESVANLYSAALRAMGPDPIPLAGTEEWAESDEAYRARINDVPTGLVWAWADLEGPELDETGEHLGFPRARLVPVPVQQEPQP